MSAGDWDEALHPRADDGKFGSGGGSSTGASKGSSKAESSKAESAKAWARKQVGGIAHGTQSHPPPSAPKVGNDGINLANKKLPPRTFTDKRPAHMAPETWMQHFHGDPRKGGRPTNERKANVHDPIAKAALNVPVPKTDEQKVAIMTMGGPASGKSSMMRGINLDKFVKVDPDHIKGQLPEYRQALKDRNNTYRGAAAMAHEESSYLAKRIRDAAIDRGNHVLIDGTGANTKKFMELMDHLKSKGYEVHVHMPHLNAEEGLKRAKARASDSGRYVPDKVVKDTYAHINNGVDQIIKKADNFHLYDAETKGHPKILTKRNGKVEVHSPEAHGRFEKRERAT